jgi:hypothetical protein
VSLDAFRWDVRASRLPAATSDRLIIVYAVGVGIVFYIVSKILLDAYVYGDQQYYRAFYTAVGLQNPLTSLTMQEEYLGSSELIYPLLAWLWSYFNIDHSVFVAFLNALLGSFLFVYLRRNNANLLFIGLVLTNYYVLALCTSAERLKLGFVFALAGMAVENKNARRVLLVLAPLAHFQMLILYAGSYIWTFLEKEADTDQARRRRMISGIGVSIALMLFLAVFGNAVLSKIQANWSVTSLESIAQGGVILGVAQIVTRDLRRVMVTFLPLLVLVLLLGGDRMNMIIVATLFFIVVRERKTSNILILLLTGYLSFKSISLVNNIFTYGDGFYSA